MGTHKYQGYFPVYIPYKAMGQPICSIGTMARLTGYTTQQGVQGICTVQCQRYWHCGCGYC